MIGIYDYTVIATYAALFISVNGIFFTFSGNPLRGLLCLIACGVIDAFDGRIARTKKDRTADGKRFGIQIDSLNDIICFGVLPAAIGYFLGLDSFPCRIVLSLYVLAGLIRLAYFNIAEETRQSETDKNRTSYLGLPITASCAVTPFAYVLCAYLELPMQPVFTLAYAAMAAAFVAPIRVKKLTAPGMVIAGLLLITEVCLILRLIYQ